MAYTPEEMLTDGKGQLIAQWFNPATNKFESLPKPATDTELALVKGELQSVKSELTAIKANQTNGTSKVQLSGSIGELSGLAADRPAAAEGNKTYTYWSVDTGDISVSTGTAWRSVGVA